MNETPELKTNESFEYVPSELFNSILQKQKNLPIDFDECVDWAMQTLRLLEAAFGPEGYEFQFCHRNGQRSNAS